MADYTSKLEPLHNRIARFVLDRFLETGHDSTIAQIAAAVGVSQSTVRKAFASHTGVSPLSDLRYDREGRDSFSRNYPSMTSGAHMVAVYGPTRRMLARVVVELRQSAATAARPE